MSRLIACCMLFASYSAPTRAKASVDLPLPVVEDLSLHRLFGRYYVIGSYFQWIETGCSNSTIGFGPRPVPNTAAITLECDRGWVHQKVLGDAVPLDPAVVARSLATFYPPLGRPVREELHMLMVAPDYEWLVIGHPKRHLLWILSRTSTLPTDLLVEILDRLDHDFGYTDARKNLTCVKHKQVTGHACRDALQARTWFDDWRID